SGPQVVEGWYGQSFPKPLARTREYIEIIRKVVAREAPVTFDGEHYPLPYPGGTGLGKALKPTVHPLRTDIPIYMGAEGPHNVALARMGYEAEATRIQDLYLDGKKDEAAAAVPTAMVEDVYLVGPKEKIRDDIEAWKESIVTTMIVAGDPQLLRTMAELVL